MFSSAALLDEAVSCCNSGILLRVRWYLGMRASINPLLYLGSIWIENDWFDYFNTSTNNFTNTVGFRSLVQRETG